MLAFFRRVVNSPVGIVLLGVVLLAFIVLGVSARQNGFSFGGEAATGDTVATVAGRTVNTTDLQKRVTQEIAAAGQNGTPADPAAFAAQGGVEQIAQQMIDGLSLEALGERIGLVAGKRLVDGQIASIPAFAGPDGRFDETLYRRFLQSAGLTDAAVRADVMGDLIRTQLLAPVNGGLRPPADLARRYAALRLEQRRGTAAFIPAAAFTSAAAPGDAEVQGFYQSHLARYSLPERRQIRYALFGLDQVAAGAKPTDAEIQAAYQAKAQQYAARDVRSLSQVVFTGPTAEADARAFAAKAKGSAFAGAAGARLIAVGEKTKAEFSDFASPAVADAAWAAPIGGTTQPTRSPFGWHVVHVQSARTIPAKTLADVRDSIAADLLKEKEGRALSDLGSKIQDELGSGASLDQVAKQHGLTVVTTPALLPDGRAPEQPGYKAPPEVAPLLTAAFQADPDDAPAIQTVTPGKEYAALALGTVSPAAPRPLASVRDTVVADLKASQAAARAQAVATAIAAKVNAGTSLADAVRQAGVALPAPQPVSGRRVDLERPSAPAAPPLRLLFTLTPGHARLAPAPGNGGWYVARLDAVSPADPGEVAQLVGPTAQAVGEAMMSEFVDEFALAARAAVKPSINPGAIASVKGRLTGAQPQQ